MPKQTVVISRHWSNPAIDIRVDEHGIQMSVTLEDFCRALASELGADPESAVEAKEAVLMKIKEASVST